MIRRGIRDNGTVQNIKQFFKNIIFFFFTFTLFEPVYIVLSPIGTTLYLTIHIFQIKPSNS